MIKLNHDTLPIPLYIVQSGDKTPQEDIEEDFAYVLAKNGVLVKRKNKLYSSIQKIDGIASLGEMDEGTITETIKVPAALIHNVESFFADIYKEHKSEAGVLLYYSFDRKEWIWSCPRQEVSPGSLDYDSSKGELYADPNGGEVTNTDGFSIMGSIHSHGSMSAFHSGVDDNDEFGFDGLHITIGNISTTPTYSARWIMSGGETKIDIEDVAEIERPKGVYPEKFGKMVKKKSVAVVKQAKENASTNQQRSKMKDWYEHGYGDCFSDIWPNERMDPYDYRDMDIHFHKTKECPKKGTEQK